MPSSALVLLPGRESSDFIRSLAYELNRLKPSDMSPCSTPLNDNRKQLSWESSHEKKDIGINMTPYSSAHLTSAAPSNWNGSSITRKNPPKGSFHDTLCFMPLK